MRYVLVMVFGLLAMPAFAVQPDYDEAGLLRNYAMAVCVRDAYADAAVRKDAQVSAGAYVEFGSVDVEAYRAIGALVEAQLAKTYAGKEVADIQLMKCIDLYNSKALELLIRQFLTQRVG